jgi:23S rRNA pseudouridine1911/1915/1917 synthase
MNENKTSFEKDFSTSFEKDFSDLVDISTKYGFTKASADTLRILDADSNNVLDVTLTEKQVIIKLADDSVKSFDRNTSGVIKSYLFLHGKTMEDITELETVKKASAKKLGQKDMVSILLNHIAQEGTGQPFIGVVHRLDQPVEGVMVFAKTKQAAAKLSAQMKDHSFGKKYYARVQLTEGKTFAEATGHATEGTLRDWMQFDRKENKSCVVEQPRKEQKNVNSKNGVQEALLDYRVIKEEEKTALLDITLHTGRHHQIRVQLAHLGTPICGDHKYGNAAGGMPELCSYHIDFIHPVSGKTMTYDIKPRNFGIAF